MIAKAKAIAHGKVAIEYAMRESKNGELVASNLIQNNTPNGIYNEFTDIQRYNTRCKNKFIRFEIGIAPKDEAKLSQNDLTKICEEFSKRLGFENHQWIACTHRDTDNLHLHMIVNRIGVDQSVYDTSFISNRASNTAEKISLDMGLTLAKNIKAKYKQRTDIVSFERMMARTRIEKLAHEALADKPNDLREFQQVMKEKGIIVSEAKNKKGNTYGLRFTGYGETFKASTIGQEFGYRTLLQTFGESQKEDILQSVERSENMQGNVNLSAASKIASGINALLNTLSDSGEMMQDDEEQSNKRNKKKKYGR
ncbi:MAG: relaxase/mobilization nuclease domain-containing protein [Dysgonomonas sp.]